MSPKYPDIFETARAIVEDDALLYMSSNSAIQAIAAALTAERDKWQKFSIRSPKRGARYGS